MKFFRAQRGAALVITLIMLGMVTTMAVVFLSISRRERASVSVITDQAGAQLMAERAAVQALSKVVGNMVATKNPLAYRFSVSTNYINHCFFCIFVFLWGFSVQYRCLPIKRSDKTHLIFYGVNINFVNNISQTHMGDFNYCIILTFKIPLARVFK